MYISVLKRNSATCFHQASESFQIQGRWNHTTKTLAKGGPLTEFKANKTFEFCLEKTVDLVYDLVLLDAYGMRYLVYRAESGCLFFKGSCLSGSKETYRFRSGFS